MEDTLTLRPAKIAAMRRLRWSGTERGGFRKDLYCRLRGVTIRLPPLRQRREDVAELAYYFLARPMRRATSRAISIACS